MTTATVTYTNLFDQPGINIRTYIDTRSNIADPKDASGARKFVYEYDPLHKDLAFSGMPYIIVFDPTEEEPTGKRADDQHQRKSWTQEVIIRTANRGSGNSTTDQGLRDMRTIMNSLIQTINNRAIKSDLRALNMYDITISVLGIDTVTLNQQLVHEVSAEIKYKTVLQVTA